MSARQGKFRVSLSTDHMQWILSLGDCPADLRKQLSLQLYKVSEGLVTPAFKVHAFSDLPLETRYKKALAKQDAGMELTSEEADAILMYRYENDLMSEDERISYEEEKGLSW